LSFRLFLRSSPVQQLVAQPRQVRKEAAVGTRFCVTQGSLTSLYFRQRQLPASMCGCRLPRKKRPESMVSFLSIIKVFGFTASPAHWESPICAQRSDRSERQEQQLSLPAAPRTGRPPFQGLLSPRAEYANSSSRKQRLRWKVCPYEKRHYYQLDGERTPYRHS